MASFSRTLNERALRARVPALLLAAGALAALTGCPASGEDVQPPPDGLVYPTGLAVSPDASALFVVNANADLLYDSGSVVVIDLAEVEALVDAWRESGDTGACERDPDEPSALACEQSLVIPGHAGVRVGSFATAIDVQELDGGALRLFVPVRGDPSVTWIDYRDGELHCEGSQEVPLCGTDNRLAPGGGALLGEPFDVFVDSANEYAVVTHLTRGAVSLVHTPRDGAPVLADLMVDLFSGNNLGLQAALGVAGRRLPGSDSTLVYVTSRTEARVQMLSVKPATGDDMPALVPAGFFFLTSVSPSDDARGIVFDADGTRAYITNRNPPMLHVIDTSSTPGGAPRNQSLTSVELCRDPANVAAVDAGQGTRVYITCFPEAQVWAVDPDAAVVEAIIPTGSGPHALAVDAQRKLLYVASFLEHSLDVVDVDPDSATHNQVVLRLRSGHQGGN